MKLDFRRCSIRLAAVELFARNGTQTEPRLRANDAYFRTFHFVGAGKSWKMSSFEKTRHSTHLIFVYDSGFKLTAFNFYKSRKKRYFIVVIKILPNRIRKIFNIAANFNFFRFAFKTRKRIAVPHVGVNKTSFSVLQRFIKERKSFAMRRIALSTFQYRKTEIAASAFHAYQC